MPYATLTSDGSQVFVNGDLATDALFVLDHTDDPMQVVQCRECRVPWCDTGGCVTVRRFGDKVVWMRPEVEIGHWDEEFLRMRHAPFVLVADEPVWFKLADYASFLRSLDRCANGPFMEGGVESIKPLSEPEMDFLLRASLVRLAGDVLRGPPSWPEVERSLLFRLVQPIGEPGEQQLLDAAERLRMGVRLAELSPDEPPAMRVLEEGFDRPGDPCGHRLLIADGEGRGSLWHAAGHGCWGRIELLSG